jgi:prepilin-type N-terminal cleavage/methylation domain-containing protein
MYRGQKGLTLIELLIVIAILGIIAAVIIPNIAGFMVSGRIAAANDELANVKTAALGYYAGVGNTTWPGSSQVLVDAGYISGTLKAAYGFDQWGWVASGNSTIDGGWGPTITFDGYVGNSTGHSGHWVAAP